MKKKIYSLFAILFIFGTSIIAQQQKYDVAAYVWPAYHIGSLVSLYGDI